MVTFGKLQRRQEDMYLRKIHHVGSGLHLSGWGQGIMALSCEHACSKIGEKFTK
jgi:hypothetical protein